MFLGLMANKILGKIMAFEVIKDEMRKCIDYTSNQVRKD
jgi:hypothetical protein